MIDPPETVTQVDLSGAIMLAGMFKLPTISWTSRLLAFQSPPPNERFTASRSDQRDCPPHGLLALPSSLCVAIHTKELDVPRIVGVELHTHGPVRENDLRAGDVETTSPGNRDTSRSAPFFGDTTGGVDRLEPTLQELILESPHWALAALRACNDLDFLQQEDVDVVPVPFDEPDRRGTGVGIKRNDLTFFLMAGPSPGNPLVESKLLAGQNRQTTSLGTLSWLEP